jgi:osmoprotectant transport system permease protein
MREQAIAALGLLPGYLAAHVLLSASALALGVALGLPLALIAARKSRLRWPILAVANLVQTIPGLALLALFYPLLLGLAPLALALFGVNLPALGFLPSLLALTLYAMLPILRNGIAGLIGIDAAVIEAADGVGMTPRQRLVRVEAPLAAPVVMAGIRTAAVWTIGAATLSTTVGQTSLGNFIFSGLQTENWVYVLFGCVAAALLALVTDQLLGLIETAAARRDGRRLAAGLFAIALGTGLALTPFLATGARTYVVGAKNFSEQFILGELIAQRLGHEGASVERKYGLGSAVVFRALASGDIDAYVDYTGTLWTNVLNRQDRPPRDAMLRELSRELRETHGVIMLGPLGFENAYALAMRRDRAAALGVGSISDLAPRAGGLSLGTDLEFLSRPEWHMLRNAYALEFRDARAFSPTFMYRAIENREVDVITAFSSDGRIVAQDLLVLADPKNAIPSYDAVLLVSPRRAQDAVLNRALAPLIGGIPVGRMREANLMVDRDDRKVLPREAAQFLARSLSLSGP